MIKDPDGLTQPIIDIYNKIEYDLIIDIAKRFDTYDEIGGSLEWQLKKLDELGTLNADMVKTIAKYSKKSQKEIYDMLRSAGFANIDFEDLQKAYNAGAILVDPVTIKNNTAFAELVEMSYKELDETFRMIQTKALESAKQSYMDVINRSYIEVATGTYDYNTSIRNAIQRMAENGITGATYKRGGKIVNYSLEATVRRDTLTAVHKLANQSSEVMCDEVGTDYVEISSHLGARVHLTNKIANHAGWQGKVYKIHGEDPEYPNLKESTGYPGDILGLGGVNCRHRMFPFVPGISTPNPIGFSEEENRKAYELSQQQRKLERDMRKLKKKKAAAKASGDKETEKKLREKIKLKSDEIDKFCEDNKLRRDYNRELVTEQITKKVAKAEKSDIIKAANEQLYFEKVKNNPDATFEVNIPNYSPTLNQKISEACKSVAKLGENDGKEHLILLDLKNGNVVYNECGTESSVGDEKFWNFLSENNKASFAFIHNHKTASSFSEADMRTLLGDNPVNMFVISRSDGTIAVVEKQKYPANLNFDALYKEDLEEINRLSRKGEITAGERTYLREKLIVDSLIRDYTKGLMKYE